MLTVEQIRDRTKTVTRRNGWINLAPGTVINACEKCMGLKKGEKVKTICEIRVVSVRREPLDAITQADVIREGFPEWSPRQFIDLFSKHNGGDSRKEVTRIEFEYM